MPQDDDEFWNKKITGHPSKEMMDRRRRKINDKDYIKACHSLQFMGLKNCLIIRFDESGSSTTTNFDIDDLPDEIKGKVMLTVADRLIRN